MLPKCLRVRTLSVLYQVWEGSEFLGLLIRKWLQPAMIHGVVWLSYCMSSRSSILKLKFILPLLRAVPLPMGSVSSAERRPEFTFQSFDRPQKAEQYKGLKGSLDSIPFYLFSFTRNLQTVFCQPEGVRPLWSSSNAAIPLTWQWIHFLQLTLCLCSYFGALWALK